MRTLHLLEATTPQGGPDGALVSISMLQRRDPDNDHILVCFAPHDLTKQAHRFGARIDSRIRTQAHRSRSASNAIRQLANRIGPFDLIQPWSASTAALADSHQDLAPACPPLPLYAPLDPDHFSAAARLNWRQRFEIKDDELVITLLDLAPNTVSAGTFGLAIAPLTCAFQDRTLVGLIPSWDQCDGSNRAKRYAETARNVWRIELVSAPLFATAIASDVILCPAGPTDPAPWRTYSSCSYALACAQASSIPVVAGSFEHSKAPNVSHGPGILTAKPGKVGLVTTLHNAINQTTHPEDASEIVRTNMNPDQWFARYQNAMEASSPTNSVTNQGC